MWREGLRPPDPFARKRPPVEELRTQDGMSLATLCGYGPVLVVFLPALGTGECRAVLARLARQRAGIEADGTRIVLVHLAADDEAARAELEPHDLHYLARIADPDHELYDDAGVSHLAAAPRLTPSRLLQKLTQSRQPIHAFLLSRTTLAWTARKPLF